MMQRLRLIVCGPLRPFRKGKLRIRIVIHVRTETYGREGVFAPFLRKGKTNPTAQAAIFFRLKIGRILLTLNFYKARGMRRAGADANGTTFQFTETQRFGKGISV